MGKDFEEFLYFRGLEIKNALDLVSKRIEIKRAFKFAGIFVMCAQREEN